MQTLLVNPNSRSAYQSLPTAIEPPVWAAMIAGKDDGILDANALNIDALALWARTGVPQAESILVLANGHNPSASTQTMPAVKAVVDKMRKGPWFLSVGGLHPSALPEQTARELGVPVTKIAPLISEKPIRWDLLPMNRYEAHNWHAFGYLTRDKYAALYTSLGCPFTCSFCNVHALYGTRKVRYFPVDWVLREIDVLVQQYEVRHLKIADELFTLDKERVKAICDGLIERGYDLNIWAYARTGLVQPQLLQKMRRAGFKWLAYGFESASQEVRDGVGKGTSEKQTQDAIEWTRDAGINICANVIFGLPDDTHATMSETLDWLTEHNFSWANMYCAMALPGSKLYDETPKEDLPETWAGYGQLAYECQPLPTKHLTAADVLKFRDVAWQYYMNRPEYHTMLRHKFGPEAVVDVKAMAQIPLKRKLLENTE